MNHINFKNLILFFLCLAVSNFGFCQDEIESSNSVQTLNLRGKLFTTREKPMTLPLANDEPAFQFIIYGDRTGGDPSGLKVLKQAVADTNLLSPDLVMTVGDLIQGYNRPPEWLQQADEFKTIMADLKMPWFPVAGNHDVYWDFRDLKRPPIHHEANYEANFGPLWYSFQHKKNGFIVLYSDEGNVETGEKGFRESRLQNMTPEQLTFLEQSLEKLKSAHRVFVFLHHPRWLGGGYEGSNWPEVHNRMVAAGNVAAVFAGHIHHMTYQGPVDGIDYFSLGTTGGQLEMEAAKLGFLHHFNIVTVRESGYSVATLPVGSVIDPKNFKLELLRDVDLVRNSTLYRSGKKLKIEPDGSVFGEYLVSYTNPGKCPVEITIVPKTTGSWQAIPDHQHIVIPPGKTDGVAFSYHRKSGDLIQFATEEMPEFSIVMEYLHESARIQLPEKRVSVDVSPADSIFAAGDSINRYLQLSGRQSPRVRKPVRHSKSQSARVKASDLKLPQGPFTLEAWIRPEKLDGSRAVVAKTQSSEFALFLHDGRPQFDVHLDGKYVSPASETAIESGRWAHIAGVYDESMAKLFVDGKLVAKLPASGQRSTNDLPLFIGADPDRFGNATREFSGAIDEVRLSTDSLYESPFEPESRFSSNVKTMLLLHFDKSFGPFLANDSNGDISVILTGGSELIARE